MNIQQLKQLPKVSQIFLPDGISDSMLPESPANSLNVINTNAALQSQINALAEQRAQEIIREQQQTQILARNGRTFTKFDRANDVIDNQTEVVTAGLWSDGLASLTTHHTGSAQTTSQRRYYVDVYQKDTSLTGSAVQYSIAYGHA